MAKPKQTPKRKDHFDGCNSEQYQAILETAMLYGPLTKETLVLSTSGYRNARHLIASAIERKYIRILEYSECADGKHDQKYKYHIISAAGINYLHECGKQEWHIHLPRLKDELRKEEYDIDKAKYKAACGDAYALAQKLGLTMSDYPFNSYPGDTTHLLTGDRSLPASVLQWGEQNDGQEDDDDEPVWMYDSDDTSITTTGPWIQYRTLADVKKAMYADWTFITPRDNKLPVADGYYFSAREMRAMIEQQSDNLDETNYKRMLNDVRRGHFVGIINVPYRSFLLYHGSPVGLGWSKGAGKRDSKAAFLMSSMTLPYHNIPETRAYGAVMFEGSPHFVNAIIDRYNKRAKPRSMPKCIGEGMSAMYAIPLTLAGCCIFKYWILDKTDQERDKIVVSEIKGPYGLEKYIPTTEEQQQATVDINPFPQYLYDGQTPVYDFSCLEMKKLEAVYRDLKEAYKDKPKPAIGCIAFDCQSKYITALFKGVANCFLFELQPPLEQMPTTWAH